MDGGGAEAPEGVSFGLEPVGLFDFHEDQCHGFEDIFPCG